MHLKPCQSSLDKSVSDSRFILEISHEQKQAVKEDAQRWDMDILEALQFILRWGFEDYFRSK